MTDTRDPRPLDPEAVAATLRSEEPSPEVLLAARGRVGETLAAAERAQHDVPGAISGCADFAALVPAYLAGALPEARRLLVQDHTRSCVSCRRLVMARSNRIAPMADGAPAASRPRRTAWLPLAAAASVALAVAGGAWVIRHGAPVAGVSTVESVTGTLISPAENAANVPAGAHARGTLRTGRDSRAVLLLSDGSRVEMGARSELSVASASSGLTVRLSRGRVLVQAAKQTGGRHLAVTTPDCAVSVVGTVFAVNHGMSGSRVSVLEGEVRVTSDSRTRALRPGDQTATRGTDRVPIADEVAFSADHERWQKLAAELQGLQADLAKAFPTPGLQHDTRLLDVAPAGTMVYGAVPNLSGGLREAWRALVARVDQGGALATALGPAISSSENRARFDEAVNVLSDIGERLGDEIAFVVVSDGAGRMLGPVVYAEARQPRELQDHLGQIVAKVNASAGRSVLRLVDDPAKLSSPHDGPTLLVSGSFVAVGFQAEPLAAFARASSGGATMAGSPLAANVAAAYREGLHDVLAADLQHLFSGGSASNPRAETLERLGILDARGLLVARRVEGDTARTEATLTFGQSRRGVAAWLAAPAPLGALDYVSSQASVAAAFAMKEPRAVVQELFAIYPELAGEAEKAEAELGFSLDRDLAASLGGDFAVAVDGPLLPTPALKLVLEVYDPARLQVVFERLVRKLDAEARAKGEAGFELTSTEAGGKLYHAVRRVGADPILHFTYDNGYLVAGTDRTVVSRALETRASGTSLRATGRLAELLPNDGPLEVSALVYQNLGAALKTSAAPSLGWARGEDNRIVMGFSGPAGLAGLDLPAILGSLADRKKEAR